MHSTNMGPVKLATLYKECFIMKLGPVSSPNFTLADTFYWPMVFINFQKRESWSKIKGVKMIFGQIS